MDPPYRLFQRLKNNSHDKSCFERSVLFPLPYLSKKKTSIFYNSALLLRQRILSMTKEMRSTSTSTLS